MATPKQKADKPLENIKPRRGMVVRLEDEPGLWMIMDRAPATEGSSAWWLQPYDDDAKGAQPHPTHKSYRSGSWRTMRKAG